MAQREAFLSDPVFSLGDLCCTVEEAAKLGLLYSDPASLRNAGFQQHHRCSPAANAYELALRAVEPLRPKLSEVDALLYATCLPLNGNIGDPAKLAESGDVKHLMDFPASHLQADLGLDRASVIGVNQQACTGMIGSLRLARALILSEPDVRQVLCVTADRFPNGARYEQAYNVISDGAAACLVTDRPEGFRILATHAITNGALAQASDDETAGSYFSYTHKLFEETLQKARLTAGDITWVVPQNTNINAWMVLSRLLNIDIDRVFFATIGEVGHLISADNMINLAALLQTGRLKSGDKLLLFMAGFGLNWQSVLLERV